MRTNHTLDLLGVPDLPLEAFKKVGGQIKPQGGSSGGGPSEQKVTSTNIPEYARPYVEDTLGRAHALTTGATYQPYAGQRMATFSPMEAQAFQNVANQQVAPQLTEASNLTSAVGQGGLATQPVAQGLQQTSLGYGQAGAGYGGAASTLGLAGAQQAMMDADRAQRGAQMYGGMGAGFGAQGAMTAAQSQRAAEGQADMYGRWVRVSVRWAQDSSASSAVWRYSG